MKIKSVLIDTVKPYERNPRHNDDAVQKVVTSLKEFGWQQPIVVDSDLVVIAGHTRLKAAHELGMKRVPIHVAEGLSEAQVKAYRLADNRTGSEATWDYDLLPLEIKDLQAFDYDVAITGFGQAEVMEINHHGEGATDPNGEWKGMPEFTQDDITSFRKIIMHFPDEAAVQKFAKLMKQDISDKAKYLWFPEKKHENFKDQEYTTDES